VKPTILFEKRSTIQPSPKEKTEVPEKSTCNPQGKKTDTRVRLPVTFPLGRLIVEEKSRTVLVLSLGETIKVRIGNKISMGKTPSILMEE